MMHGGGQERRLRPGSLPVHQIVGAGAAAVIARDQMSDDLAHTTALRDRLWKGLSDLPGILRNGAADKLDGHIVVHAQNHVRLGEPHDGPANPPRRHDRIPLGKT